MDTARGCEESETSLAYANRSAIYQCTRTGGVKGGKSCTPLGFSATLRMPMKIILRALIENMKPLAENGNKEF